MPDAVISAAALQAVQTAFPVALRPYDLAGKRPGLVIVDAVDGFCTVGRGPLAPTAPDERIARMVVEIDRLARRFVAAGWPVAASRDSHDADRPEPPYPPHCLKGSGDDELVAELRWLETEPQATVFFKNCINLFVGSITPDGGNKLMDWIADNRLDTVVAVGICTDICVMDFVLTLLSARNAGLAEGLVDVVVYEPACATYSLPLEIARAVGLPDAAAHPQAEAHHAGLYMMASRGAVLVDRLDSYS
ncbi:isochorismatase family protein [bacterium]|nr:isochorismatase family protein [bacterium]